MIRKAPQMTPKKASPFMPKAGAKAQGLGKLPKFSKGGSVARGGGAATKGTQFRGTY